MCPRKTLRKKRDKGTIFLIISEQFSDDATLYVSVFETELSLFLELFEMIIS